MDKLKIQATGFPLTTEALKFMVDTYEGIYKAIGPMVDPDDNVILWGMKDNGSSITNGFAVVKGEVLPFVGGASTGTVVLIEEVTDAAYNDNIANPAQITDYPTYFKRYLKPGNPGEGMADYPWSSFKRLKSLIDISASVDPATTTRKGIIEIATQSEVNAGSDNTRAVTPATLAARTATESRRGIIEIATQAEVDAGTDDTRAVTPAKLSATQAQFGKIVASGTISKSETSSSDIDIILNEYVSLLTATSNRDNRYSVITMLDSVVVTNALDYYVEEAIRAEQKANDSSVPVYGFYIRGRLSIPNANQGTITATAYISYMVIEWP